MRNRPTWIMLAAIVHSSDALRAAIIGGGLGGLTCCNALRKVGIDAQVFERAEKLSPQAGTGLTLWPNGLSAIEAIDAGAISEIIGAGSATLDIEVMQHGLEPWCTCALADSRPPFASRLR
jgi:2-polyprenyl-6-methoxyphenol hydroxylase-like FAD-dependent oxidoreductase